MHLGEEQWDRAYEDFFEAFKNYDESGSAKKITCLKCVSRLPLRRGQQCGCGGEWFIKGRRNARLHCAVSSPLLLSVFASRVPDRPWLRYLVLANMLMKSKVDPFDAQESKPYRNDPQILAMTNLVRCVWEGLVWGVGGRRAGRLVLSSARISIIKSPSSGSLRRAH